MWKWYCPNSKIIDVHHSYKDLDEMLTGHEIGINVPGGIQIPGFRSFPACNEIHDYWDDGEPCTWPKCKIPYIPEVEEVDYEPREACGPYGRASSERR